MSNIHLVISKSNNKYYLEYDTKILELTFGLIPIYFTNQVFTNKQHILTHIHINPYTSYNIDNNNNLNIEWHLDYLDDDIVCQIPLSDFNENPEQYNDSELIVYYKNRIDTLTVEVNRLRSENAVLSSMLNTTSI